MNTDHYTPDSTGDIKRWEIYNTAVRESIEIGYTLPGAAPAQERKLTRGQLAYYECRNSEYPDVRDCEGIPIFPHTDLGGGNYQMHKVRHHKMPDTTLEPHFYGNVRVGLSGIGYMGDNPHDWNNSYDQSYIVTLGVEVDNVQIPESIADRVQGYRIVKALANEADKTVIDKGIMFNIHYSFSTWAGCDPDNGNAAVIENCAYAFQGNRFNKQLGEFACAHVPLQGKAVPEKYLGNLVDCPDPTWPQPQGITSIAADNYYCFEFHQPNFPYAGFVLRYEAEGTENCFATNAKKRTKLGFMAPLIVNDDWQNWWGCNGGNEVNPIYNGLNDLKNPTSWVPGCDPDPVKDKMYKGVGYPLGNWGWRSPASSTYPEEVRIEDSDGINLGYETEMIAYPNSSMGYHGPLSKFKEIKSASYVKTERVLIGYSQNIICNTSCCENDQVRTNDPSLLNGTGEYVSGRDDGHSDEKFGTSYVYTRMAYFQSAVPYTNPSQTFDPANNMQWERWGNACSYQPDTANSGPTPAAWATDNVAGSGHRGQSIWQNQSTRYSKPLQNVRLTKAVKIDPYTPEVYSLEDIIGYPLFSNHSQQEVLLMGFSWKDLHPTTNQRVYWAWPWPGNNYSRGGVVSNYNNYTRIPFDHAYSRFTCYSLYDRWEIYDDTFTGLDRWAMNSNVPGDSDAITGPPEQMDSTDPYYDAWYDLDGNPYFKPLNGAGTAYYVSIKRNSYDAYGAIFNLTYTTTHNCMVKVETEDITSAADEIYGGDSFISRFAFKQTQESAKTSRNVKQAGDEGCIGFTNIQPGNSTGGWGATAPNGAFGAYENMREACTSCSVLQYGNFNNIVQYWVESYINTELRLGNINEPGELIYPYHFEGNNALYGTAFFVDDARLQDEGLRFSEESTFETHPNYYALNEDYNKAAVESTFSPLPLQFDYCSDCSNKHPHRISYSEVSIDNEQSDAYRNFLTGNFRDIPGNRGEVWNVWTSNNALYIHTA
jgi:hypothetical protein